MLAQATSYLTAESIAFWLFTLLGVQNIRVVLLLVKASPQLIRTRITLIMPRAGREAEHILAHDHNEAKLNLLLWHLPIRDVWALMSLFSGIFMVGAYVTFGLKTFNIEATHVFIFVGVNARVLFLHTLKSLQCQKECIGFGEPDLASHIKAGYY